MTQSQSQSQGPVTGLAGLFDGYPALAGTYDEMFDAGATARAPFARVAALLAKLSSEELARTQALAETALLFLLMGRYPVFDDVEGNASQPVPAPAP